MRLQQEIGDIQAVVSLLVEQTEIGLSYVEIASAERAKREKLKRFLFRGPAEAVGPARDS